MKISNLWLISAFAAVTASAQVTTTNVNDRAKNTSVIAMFSFGNHQLKCQSVQTDKLESLETIESPMTFSNGGWYYEFSIRGWSKWSEYQNRSEITDGDYDKVGYIELAGRKYAVTEGPSICDMNAIPDANRDELLREQARRVELGNGLFISEEGSGYHLTDKISILVKSTSKVELNWNF